MTTVFHRLFCCFKLNDSVDRSHRSTLGDRQGTKFADALDRNAPVHAYFSLMLQSILDPVALFSQAGTLLANNPASVDLFNHIRHTMLGFASGGEVSPTASLQLLFATDLDALQDAMAAVQEGRTWRGLLHVPQLPPATFNPCAAVGGAVAGPHSLQSCQYDNSFNSQPAQELRRLSADGVDSSDCSTEPRGHPSPVTPTPRAHHAYCSSTLNDTMLGTFDATDGAAVGVVANGIAAGGGCSSYCPAERRSELLVDVLTGSLHGRDPAGRMHSPPSACLSSTANDPDDSNDRNKCHDERLCRGICADVPGDSTCLHGHHDREQGLHLCNQDARTLYNLHERHTLHNGHNANYCPCSEPQPQPLVHSSPPAAAPRGNNTISGGSSATPGSLNRCAGLPHWQQAQMMQDPQVSSLDPSASGVGCASGADQQDSRVRARGGGGDVGGRGVESSSRGRRSDHGNAFHGLAAAAAILRESSRGDHHAALRDRMRTDGAAPTRASRSLDVSTRLPRQESISEPSMCPGASPTVMPGGAAAATGAFLHPIVHHAVTRSTQLGPIASSPFLRSPVAASGGGGGSCHCNNAPPPLPPPLQQQQQPSGRIMPPQRQLHQYHSFHAGSEVAAAAAAALRGGGGAACCSGAGCRTGAVGAAAGRRAGAGLVDISAHGDARGLSTALSRMAPCRGGVGDGGGGVGGGGGGAMDDINSRNPVHGPGHPGSDIAAAQHDSSSHHHHHHHHCHNHLRLTKSQAQQQQRQRQQPQQQSALQLQMRRAFHQGVGSGRWPWTGSTRHASWCGSCGGILSPTSTATRDNRCQKVANATAGSDSDGGDDHSGGGGGGGGGADMQGCLQLGSLVAPSLKLPLPLLPSLRRDPDGVGMLGQATPMAVRPQTEPVAMAAAAAAAATLESPEIGHGKLSDAGPCPAPTGNSGNGFPNRMSPEAVEGAVTKMEAGELGSQKHGCGNAHQHLPGTSLLSIAWDARSAKQNNGSPSEACVGSVETAEATFMWYNDGNGGSGSGGGRGAEDPPALGKTGSRHRPMSATSLSAAAGALSAAHLPDMAAAAADGSGRIGGVAGARGTQSTRPGSEGSAVPWAFPQQHQAEFFAVNAPPPLAVGPSPARLLSPQQTAPPQRTQSPPVISATPSSSAMDGGGGGGPCFQTCDAPLLFQNQQEQLWQALSTSTWGTMVGGRARNRSSCTGGIASGGSVGGSVGGTARRHTLYMESRSVRCGTAYSNGGAARPHNLLHLHSSVTPGERIVCGVSVSGGGPPSHTPPDGRGSRSVVGAPQVCRSVNFPVTCRAGPDGASGRVPPYAAAQTGLFSSVAASKGSFDPGFGSEIGGGVPARGNPVNALLGGDGGGGVIGFSNGNGGHGRGGGDGATAGRRVTTAAAAASGAFTGSEGQLCVHDAQRSCQAASQPSPPPSSEAALTSFAEILPPLAPMNTSRSGAINGHSSQPQAHSLAHTQEFGHTAVAADNDNSTHRSPKVKSTTDCQSPMKRHPYGPVEMAPLSEHDDGDGVATGAAAAAEEIAADMVVAAKAMAGCVGSPAPAPPAPGAGLAVPRIVQLAMRSMAKAVSTAGTMQRSPCTPYSSLGSPGGSSHCAADASMRGGAHVSSYNGMPVCEYGSAAVLTAVLEAADPYRQGAACGDDGTTPPPLFHLHGSSTLGLQSRPFGSAVLPGISNEGSLVRGDGHGSCGRGGRFSVTAAAMAVAAASVDSSRRHYTEGTQFQSSPWILDSNHGIISEWTQGTDRVCPVMSTAGGAAAATGAPSSVATTSAVAPAETAAASDMACRTNLDPLALPAVPGNDRCVMTVEGGRWFEVVVSGIPHPATGEILLLVVQHDISSRVWAEKHLARVMEAEHLLLESIFPQHVLEHIAVMAATSALPGEDEAQGGWLREPQPSSALQLRAPPQLAPERPQQRQQEVAVGQEQWPGSGHAHGTSLSLARHSMHGMGPPGVSPAIPITGNTFLHLATSHSALTVLFCDIQGFTTMCNSVKPATVMSFLNDLYTRLDAMLDAFGVYKVETIGDCYMVAGGLMKVDEETGAVTVRSDDVDPQHAHRTVQFAKALLHAASAVRLPNTGEPVRLRVGIHSGPAMSGVVGTRMPRFCLFGDTINTASRMESTGVPGAIHVSQATRDLTPNEPWEPTGGVEAKGKGRMMTYLLRTHPSEAL